MEMRSHGLKLRRAREHFQELETKIDRWVHVDGCSISVTPDPEPPTYLVRAQLLSPPDEDGSLSLLIGDVLQNGRAALEHVAFALAEAGAEARGKPLTEQEIEQSSFPIIGDADRDGYTGRGPDLFRSAAAQKLSAVTPEARAVIQELQPFYTGLNDYDNLWILNELARLDRHRFPHLTAVRSGDLRLDPARTRNVKVRTLEVFSAGGIYYPEIEDSAELARLTAIKANPQEKMDMHFTDALTIALESEDLPLIHGNPVADTLNSCLVGVSMALMRLEKHLTQ
jgi:hypothetical protein